MRPGHQQLLEFHNACVQPSSALRRTLAQYRDLNCDRLYEGLEQMGRPLPVHLWNQGSYAMHTVTQKEFDNIDIDIAVVFRDRDLPRSSVAARTLVLNALERTIPPNFTDPPRRRTNAVTVWYQAGYHVDFAVYRCFPDGHMEHAGRRWGPADPRGLVEWFKKRVQKAGPKRGRVEGGQLRRMVRLLKDFARSREDWELPGGLVLSVLAAEVFTVSRKGDDVAFRRLLEHLLERTRSTRRPLLPIPPKTPLTRRREHLCRLRQLHLKTRWAVRHLQQLDHARGQRARDRIWGKLFNHDWWPT